MRAEAQPKGAGEADCWSGRARALRYDRDSNRRFYEGALDRLLRGAPVLSGHGLDLGCGTGFSTEVLLARLPDVQWQAVDGSPDMLAIARGKPALAGLPLRAAQAEALPFADASFDVVFSHEVLEHVRDDQLCAQEMVRVVRPGGRILIFVPNRLYPFETHGIYVRGQYRFGNIPLVNWLPTPWRNRLAPHVRAYTARGLRRLFTDLPVKVTSHTVIFPGYDNIVARRPALGRLLQRVTYTLERTPLRALGLSHFLVLERLP